MMCGLSVAPTQEDPMRRVRTRMPVTVYSRMEACNHLVVQVANIGHQACASDHKVATEPGHFPNPNG